MGKRTFMLRPPRRRRPRARRLTFKAPHRCTAGGPTVNQPDRPSPESQKKHFSQTIKARPFPGCETERRPAPPFAVDAGHDTVSRPISRVLYPSLEGRWPSLWDGGYPPPLATNPRTGPGIPSSSYSVLLRVGFAQPAGHPTAGELLPHHFTLILPEKDGVFLWYCP